VKEAQGFEGPLAEFSALRQEIDERVRTQNQLLTLQLTFCGAVFAFAISRAGMIALLLVVPVVSQLLCGRLVAQHFGTLQASRYIREELAERIPGGLGWEQWRIGNTRGLHMLGSTIPLFLTFVGSSLVALAWTSRLAFVTGDVGWAARAGLILIWLTGLFATSMSAMLLTQRARSGQ
jgi:hypothetical protein